MTLVSKIDIGFSLGIYIYFETHLKLVKYPETHIAIIYF